MSSPRLLLLIGALALVGCKDASKTAKTAGDTNASGYSSGNPLTAPVDYLGAVGQAKKMSEKTIDLASLQNAVQLFQAGEGRLPSSLQELVKEGYMPRLPDAPYGMRIVYDPRSGQVRILRGSPAPSAPSAPPR